MDNNIEQIIIEALNKQKKEIIEEIENMHRDSTDKGGGCVTCGLDSYECKCELYNQALKDIKELFINSRYSSR